MVKRRLQKSLVSVERLYEKSFGITKVQSSSALGSTRDGSNLVLPSRPRQAATDEGSNTAMVSK
jgi:hypothetical protein